MINRTKPSGSANSALKQLSYALLKNQSEQDLGFKKYQQRIYRSLIKRNGLHKFVDRDFKLISPRMIPSTVANGLDEL